MSFLDKMFSGAALALRSLTTDIDVSSSPAPTPGQVLTALDGTHARWASPSGGGGGGTADALATTGGPVDVSGAAPPAAGQVLTALDADGAEWADPSWVPLSLYESANVVVVGLDGDGGIGPVPVFMPPNTVLMRADTGDVFAGTPADLAALSGSAPLWMPPAAPHADDIEFVSASAPAGFECRVNTGTGPVTVAAMTLGSAAPNPYARLAQGVGNVVFGTQRASWMHLQSWPTNASNNAYPAVYCRPLTAPATNMFLWARLGALMAFAGYDGAQSFRLCFASALAGHPDPSLWVGVGLGNQGGSRVYQGAYCPAGGTSGAYTLIPNSAAPSLLTAAAAYEYVAIHKIGTVYHFWLFNDGLDRVHLGSITLGAFVPTWYGFEWNLDNLSATQPGTPVNCADFIRRIDTAVFPF